MFRRGLPEDAPQIFKLVAAEKMNPFNLKPERFLVAEEEEEEGEEEENGGEGKRSIVAFGQLAELQEEEESGPQLFELRSFVTVPRWRGQGIGSSIAKGLLEEAASRKKEGKEGKEALVVLTTISRRRDFYSRLGFEELFSSSIPKQLRLEIALGTIMARLVVGDSIIVMGKRV